MVGLLKTALPLWAQICAQLFNQLRASMITLLIVVRSKHLISVNVCELFSSNRGISYFYTACCINELSRGFVLGCEILTNN